MKIISRQQELIRIPLSRRFVVSLRYEDERNGREGTQDESKKREGNEDE